MMTTTTMIAIIKVTNYAEDYFYAADLGIQGGTIKALEEMGFIEKSGKTKEYLMEIGENLLRKVTVNEWHIIRRTPLLWVKCEFESAANEILACADLLRSECGF